MAGPMTHADYVADDGNTYRIRIPAWVATLQSAAAAASVVHKPTGLRPRKRYYRVTATGAERSFVVLAASNAMYTDAYNTAVTVENGVYGGTGVAATLQGRTGERTKNL
jgi:hypothetical protein